MLENMIVPYRHYYRNDRVGLKPAVRRASSDTVSTLFYIGIFIVAGVLLFVKVFTKLDAERDSDFSATANATIAGVESDFFSGVDLLRISLIIIPVAVIMGYLLLVRMRG